MKARRIKANVPIEEMPFVANHRKGDLPPDNLRRQAAGEMARATPADLRPARFIRSIALDNGPFANFGADGGALLTIVISGVLTVTTDHGDDERLVAGDMLLTDSASADDITLVAHGGCRLLQLGVPADWPDAPEAQLQDQGTILAREGDPVLKRLRTGPDGRSYFSEFSELFSERIGQWSASRPVVGFRFMCWEDGFFDWHPEVVNHLGVVLAGELAVEAGGDGESYAFRAGDVLMAEDRTGAGHLNRCRGKIYVALVEMATEDLWRR